jgi:hypothetical protein
MNDEYDVDYDFDEETEPHVIEANELLDSYDGADLGCWASVDLCRFQELIDIELQQRAPRQD